MMDTCHPGLDPGSSSHTVDQVVDTHAVSPAGGRAEPAGESPVNPVTEADIVAEFLPYNPFKIILFGSRASGDHDEYSDVDVIIVYDTDKKFLDRLAELYTSWSLPRAVDILAYTPQEFELMLADTAFLQDVVSTGKVLYEVPA